MKVYVCWWNSIGGDGPPEAVFTDIKEARHYSDKQDGHIGIKELELNKEVEDGQTEGK